MHFDILLPVIVVLIHVTHCYCLDSSRKFHTSIVLRNSKQDKGDNDRKEKLQQLALMYLSGLFLGLMVYVLLFPNRSSNR